MNNLTLVLIGGALLLLSQKGLALNYAQSTKRGIRNNNPGNLIKTNINWKGKVPLNKNTDPEYEQFYTAHDGIRAMFMDLRNDIEKQKLNTISKLIHVYSPKAPMQQYVSFVSKKLNMEPDALLKRTDYMCLGKAIIEFENGEQPYPQSLIVSAFKDSLTSQ